MIIFTGEKGKENKELSVLLDENSVREIIGTFKDNEKYFEAVTKHYKNKDAEDYEVKNIEASYFPDQVRNYVKQYGGVKLQNEGEGLPNYYKECITEPHLQASVMAILHNEIDLDEADSKIKNSIDDGESPEDLANEPFLKQDEVNAVLKMSDLICLTDKSSVRCEKHFHNSNHSFLKRKQPHYVPLCSPLTVFRLS